MVLLLFTLPYIFITLFPYTHARGILSLCRKSVNSMQSWRFTGQVTMLWVYKVYK